jgi:hypothetical protein
MLAHGFVKKVMFYLLPLIGTMQLICGYTGISYLHLATNVQKNAYIANVNEKKCLFR